MSASEQQQPTDHLVGCIPLLPGETLRVVDPRSVLVYVPQGRVWITEEHCSDDVVLDEGGWHRLDRPGAAVVEAFSPALLLLTSPHETGFAAEVATHPRPALPRDPRTKADQATDRLPAWRRPSAALLRLAAQPAGRTG